MPDLIKGLALLGLLFLAMLFFLIYTVYKLNERNSLDKSEEFDGITEPEVSYSPPIDSSYELALKKN